LDGGVVVTFCLVAEKNVCEGKRLIRYINFGFYVKFGLEGLDFGIYNLLMGGGCCCFVEKNGQKG
jgi:hypothetical protein